MFTKIFLVAFCSALFAQSLALPNSRIVGGAEADDGQFPHQISLLRFGSHTCGGSILNNNYVLTAAHCIDGGSPSQYVVLAGTNYLNRGGVRRNVKRIIMHENYGNFLNDVALLELSAPLEFSDVIKPIEIYREEVPAGSPVIISGWGRIYQGGPISNALKFNTLKAISQRDCSNQIGMNYAGLICLAHSSNNGACNGDSGGPALYNGKLVGVANFVYGGCGTSYPDGYAKVSFFVDWINKKVA